MTANHEYGGCSHTHPRTQELKELAIRHGLRVTSDRLLDNFGRYVANAKPQHLWKGTKSVDGRRRRMTICRSLAQQVLSTRGTGRFPTAAAEHIGSGNESSSSEEESSSEGEDSEATVVDSCSEPDVDNNGNPLS